MYETCSNMNSIVSNMTYVVSTQVFGPLENGFKQS